MPSWTPRPGHQGLRLLELPKKIDVGAQIGVGSDGCGGSRVLTRAGGASWVSAIFAMDGIEEGGLVAAVHTARRMVLGADAMGSRANGTVDLEVDCILEQLKQLDQLEDCNDLDLLQRLKRALMQHVSAPPALAVAPGSAGGEATVPVLGLNTRSGLDAVRKEMLQEIQSCVLRTVSQIDSNTDDMGTRLLTVSHRSHGAKANKKQKASGYFSFSFDDLPLFEPLETILALLRENPLDSTALRKMVALDVGELAEHPQWGELVGLLYSSLQHSWKSPPQTTQASSVVLLHVRLMHGFEGEQRIDIAHNLMRHLWQCWIVEESGSNSSNRSRNRFDEDSANHANLAIFIDIIQCTLPQLQYCNSKQSDLFVATLFLLLAKGTLHFDNNAQPVLDFLTAENASSITDLMRLRSIGITIHAINSSLFSVLYDRMREAHNVFGQDGVQRGLPPVAAKRFVVDACLFFGLSRSLLRMNRLEEMTCSAGRCSEFHWDGRMTAFMAAADSSPSGEAAMEILCDSNKLFTHLSCPTSLAHLLTIIQGERHWPVDISAAQNHLQLLSSCTSTLLACTQQQGLSSKATAKANLGGMQSAALLMLEHASKYEMQEMSKIVQALWQTIKNITTSAHDLGRFLRGLQSVSRRSTSHSFSEVGMTFWTELWMSVTEFAMSLNKDFSNVQVVVYAAWHHHLQCVDAAETGLQNVDGSSSSGSATCNTLATIDDLNNLLLRLVLYSVDWIGKMPTDDPASCMMVHFLSSLISCRLIRKALVGTQDLVLAEVVGVLIRHIAAASNGDLESVNGASATASCSSLLVLVLECGPAVLTENAAIASFYGGLEAISKRCDVWDLAQAQNSITQLPLPVWQLLCGLALIGYTQLAAGVEWQEWMTVGVQASGQASDERDALLKFWERRYPRLYNLLPLT